jgi:SAM-dependent methyltransferase
VVGIDISQTFIDLASQAAESEGLAGLASFHRHDARQIPKLSDVAGAFEAVSCLCQGAFGLMRQNSEDELVLAGMAQAMKNDGTLVLSAFNAYFAVKYHSTAEFDADHGVSSEMTEIRNPQGEIREVALHTGCYTPRELRLLCRGVGLDEMKIFSAEPGAYGSDPPSTETAEFLVFASR